MSDRPLTVQQVSDFLKTKCPNHIVAFGFVPPFIVRIEDISIIYDIGGRVSVSNMLGNLSHAIREGCGSYTLAWPSKMFDEFLPTMETEYVTMDTLEEMGMKSNE